MESEFRAMQKSLTKWLVKARSLHLQIRHTSTPVEETEKGNYNKILSAFKAVFRHFLRFLLIDKNVQDSGKINQSDVNWSTFGAASKNIFSSVIVSRAASLLFILSLSVY